MAPYYEDRDKHEEDDQADAEPQRVLHDCGEHGTPDLTLLHFNDVYHPGPSEQEPLGGAARFKTVCQQYRDDDAFKDHPRPLTLFSGDALNPSKESTVTKGDHMIPILNALEVDAACPGNHEFDFGAAHFAFLAKSCEFPWLLANIYDPEFGERQPMGRCQRTKIIETSSGLKVGLMGLVEKEWTEKLDSSLPADLEYVDMKEVAEELGPKLREEGADIVIVLAHARQERDYDFCDSLPAGTVDLVLGGHDHWVEHEKFQNGVHFVRSGFDFKNLSYISGYKTSESTWDFTVVRRNLHGGIEEDKEIKQMQEDAIADIEEQLQRRIGSAAVPLEARRLQSNTEETNLGNFVSDLMRLHHGADCALINGGTIKGDRVYPSGPLLLKDIVDCFPFEDPIVMIRVSGQDIKDALENGVRSYPKDDVCFPHVSNIRFCFDPDAKVGHRVYDVSLAGERLDLSRKYTIATRSHLAAGKCGYKSLLAQADGGHAEEVVDDENGILVSGLLRLHFSNVQSAELFRHIESKHHNHWDEVLGKLRGVDLDQNEEQAKAALSRRAFLKWRRLAGHEPDLEMQMREQTGELFWGWRQGIAPKVEGRVRAISKENRPTGESGVLQTAQKFAETNLGISFSDAQKTSASFVQSVKTTVADTFSQSQ